LDKKVVCVIPSRYGAQRLPGKPLVKLLGKPMIQWVWEAVRGIEEIAEVLVATDDARIAEAVRGFGGEAVMTPVDCPSGTDRIQAALAGRRADIVLNVQGDEPGMRPESVRIALSGLTTARSADVGTACVPIRTVEEFNQPHAVKVVRAGDRALYFSRAPIPSLARVDPQLLSQPGFIPGYKHLGLYAYTREALESFVRLPPSPLELREKLEQMRFLEMGATLMCPETLHDSIGVDVAEDVPAAEKLLRQLHQA